MTGLLRSELRRLTHRRVARIIAIILLAITVLALGRIAMVSERLSQADRVRIAAEETERYRRDCQQFQNEFGGQAPGDTPMGPDGVPLQPRGCEEFTISPDDVQDRRLNAKDALGAGVQGVASAMTLVALIIGASYVGAEWNHGTMQALLFWEPRRARVLLAKAVALVAVVSGFLLALQAFVYLGLYAIAAARGTTEGVTGGLHMSNLLTVLRALVAVSLTGLLAFAISGLARYTAAALGFFAGYFIIVENLIRGLRPGWQRYLIGENTGAILNKSVEVAPARGRTFRFDEMGEQMYRLTATRGALTLGIYVALLLAAFYYSFTRRDVT